MSKTICQEFLIILHEVKKKHKKTSPVVAGEVVAKLTSRLVRANDLRTYS